MGREGKAQDGTEGRSHGRRAAAAVDCRIRHMCEAAARGQSLDLSPCRTCTDTPWACLRFDALPGTLGSPMCRAPPCSVPLVPETCST